MTRTLVSIRRVRDLWILRPRRLAEQLLYARSNSHRVVRDDEQGVSRVTLWNVRRRDLVDCILREQFQPLVQPPLVEQSRLLVEKVFHFLAAGQFHATHAAFLARFSCGSVMS